MFVDDDDFYQHCFVNNVNDAIRNLNIDLNELVNWSKKIGIEINIKKTRAMILGSSYNLSRIDNLDILPVLISNTVIPFVNNFKNLGVQISRDLLWNEQISAIISKVNYSLASFYRRTRFFPRNVKILLANSLLLPHFEYCNLVYNSLTHFLDEKLKKLQNQCIRFIFDLRKFEHITPYRKQLNWLTPSGRRKFSLGVLTYKIINIKKTRVPL